MATGKSGTFVITNTGSSGLPMGYTRFTWAEEYDIASNTSTVKITNVELLSAGDGYGNRNYGLGNLWFNGTVSIDGTVVATVTRGSHFLCVPAYNEYKELAITSPALPWTNSVEHNSDGSRSVTLSVSLHALSSGSDARTNTNISGSTTLELTTIPRASTLTVGNGTIGSALAITINRASSSFTHTLSYSFGGATGTIVAKTTGTAVSWTPAMSLCSKIPNAASGSCTITCDTYSGSTQIGSTTRTITLTVPASVKPTVAEGWATVSYDNTGTAAASITDYVQGYSKARVTLDGSKLTHAYGATTASTKITFGGKDYADTTPVLTAAGSQSVTVTVTDTRGRTASQQLSFTVLGYAVPVLSGVEVFRCTDEGTAADDGIYYSAKANVTFSSLNGQNAVTLSVRHKAAGGSYGDWQAMTPGTALVLGQILTTATYVVELLARDSLGNTGSNTVTIPTATVGMHLRTAHDGVGFGKYCEHENALELPEGWSIRIGDRALSKTDIGLGNVANVLQYSASNPPPYPVTSVAGRTGAVTLSKSDVGLGNVTNSAQVTGKVLWTNASPTSAFAAQTVSLTLTSYPLICVLFLRNNNALSTTASTTNAVLSAFTTKNASAMVNYKEGDYTSRLFSYSNTGVKFLAGSLNGSSNNQVMIPYKIIGFGGVA